MRRARWSGYARTVARFRWLLVVGWLGVAVAAALAVPGLDSGGSLLLQAAIPADAGALATQRAAVQEFGVPVLTRVMAVARDPDGLSVGAQTRAIEGAVLADTGGLPVELSPIAAAVPVLNTFELFPSASEAGTTVVTYLYFAPDTAPWDQVRTAELYRRRYLDPPGAVGGVTGPFAAEFDQAGLITGALRTVELASIGIVILVIGLRFRSVVAPLLGIAAVVVTYLCSTRLLVLLSAGAGLGSPGYLEPVLVVLLVGIMTDYAVFFLSTLRQRLQEGVAPDEAVRRAISQTTPLVLTAGAAVVAGVATLTVARLPIVSRLGPGMAITVVVTVAVAVTGLTAALAVLGRWSLWPSREARAGGRPHPAVARIGGVRAGLLSLVVRRWVAAIVMLLGLAALTLGAWPLLQARLGLNLFHDLPASATSAQATRAAADGFAPGIVAPVELVIRQPRIAADRGALERLQRELARAPGVAGVIGPLDQPVPGRYGLALAPDGSAARYLVILAEQPYAATGIEKVRRLQQNAPVLLADAGLSRAQADWTGDTVLAAEISSQSRHDLLLVGGAALAGLLLILVVFLRALVAPIVLLALSALAVLTTLGITDLLFGGAFGLTFYVPVAVLVLLLSFGSDYNIFLVGRIWRATEEDPDLSAAIRSGGPDASRVIGVAGLALALTFAMLALVPLSVFRALAFAMVFGVLLDTFVVRAALVPAALTLLGPHAAWPSHRLHRPAEESSSDQPGNGVGVDDDRT